MSLKPSMQKGLSKALERAGRACHGPWGLAFKPTGSAFMVLVSDTLLLLFLLWSLLRKECHTHTCQGSHLCPGFSRTFQNSSHNFARPSWLFFFWQDKQGFRGHEVDENTFPMGTYRWMSLQIFSWGNVLFARLSSTCPSFLQRPVFLFIGEYTVEKPFHISLCHVVDNVFE